MSARTATARPAAVRRKVAAWLAESDNAEAIALCARPEWDTDPVLTVGGARVRVVPCRTPLAVRAALAQQATPEKLVLLTPLSEDELGDALLARLSRRRVRSIDRWDLVRQVFGGVRLDPGVVAVGRWAGDALIDHAPPEGWPLPPGAVVTREHALRQLASRLLGLDSEQIDSAGLLQWTTDPTALMRFTSLPDETIDGITGYLGAVVGPATAPIMAAVRAGHGADVIPLGLLVGVLWPEPAGGAVPTDIAVARARLEPWFGGVRLTDQQARSYRDAAEAWLDRALDSGGQGEARRLLDRAEAVAAQIDMTPLLSASKVLPSGLQQRVGRFAEAVRLAAPDGPVADPVLVARAQSALAELEAHRAATRDRIETARMAVRLLRWLATEEPSPPATLYEALHRHVHEGGWVDRARLDIFAGDAAADPALSTAYRRLHQSVTARRAGHDQRFATLLAEATTSEAAGGALVRVEDVLERVVRPILEHNRQVLLLIMDGMGVAAATELAESITETRVWVELSPDGGPRTGVLAALPTVTEVSRCSLLSGRIAAGGQGEEQAAFGKLFPEAVLLHKAHLRTGAGDALDPEVRAAITNPSLPLVAAVINTIDDALDRAEPGTVVWDTQSVRAVAHLLAHAQNRVVVVVSDHGHVVDRGTDAQRRGGQSQENRWRIATEPAGEGEVAVSGSRVVVPPSHRPPGAAAGVSELVLAWREELRYGPRKAGYHGGAAPAEAVIPLLMFSAGDEHAVPGWAGAPVSTPAWWRESMPEDASPPQAAPPRPRSRPAAQEAALFPLPAPDPSLPATAVPTRAAESPSLVAALLASEVYAQRRDTRAPLPDERVAALLEVLLAGGGRATMETLAARAGVPAHRISGTVAALRRLLQVEGYPVLEVDPDGTTVKLDVTLLREQFGLGTP